MKCVLFWFQGKEVQDRLYKLPLDSSVLEPALNGDTRSGFHGFAAFTNECMCRCCRGSTHEMADYINNFGKTLTPELYQIEDPNTNMSFNISPRSVDSGNDSPALTFTNLTNVNFSQLQLSPDYSMLTASHRYVQSAELSNIMSSQEEQGIFQFVPVQEPDELSGAMDKSMITNSQQQQQQDDDDSPPVGGSVDHDISTIDIWD